MEESSKFPEKIGNFLLILIMVICFLLFAFFLTLFFVGFSNDAFCSGSASIRNWYQAACLQIPYTGIEFFCISDILLGIERGLGSIATGVLSIFGIPTRLPPFTTPLVGCAYRDYQVATYSEFLDRIGGEIYSCWKKFGGNQWNVLWFEDNPAICAIIHSELKENLSVREVVGYLSKKVIRKQADCRLCANPCNPGFYCYPDDPTKCARWIGNPLNCSKVEGYVPCPQGFSLMKERKSKEECMDLYHSFGLAHCDPGFYYDASIHECRNAADPSQRRGLIWPSEVYADGYCTYCFKEAEDKKLYTVPNECLIFDEVVNESCYVNISMFQELNGSLIFSIGNFTSKGLVDYEDDTNLSGKIDAFIFYLDSFSSSRKAPRIRYLPPECAVATFKDSCGICYKSCASAALTGAFAPLFLPKIHSWSTRLKSLGSWYLIGEPWHAADCLSCLTSNFQSSDLPICDDKILICIVKRE